MLSIRRFDNILLFRPFADFRMGINGLCSVIQEEMELSPFENFLFIFCNKNRNQIKAVYWDNTGFCLWNKRLENEKFKWPFHLEDKYLKVNQKKLLCFLEGLDPWQVPHKKLHYSYA